jgi:hypothetical protein
MPFNGSSNDSPIASMNEYTSSSIPPQIPPLPGQTPLGATADEREPIGSPVTAIEALLREPRRVLFQAMQSGKGALSVQLLLVAIVSSLIYGAVVGAFSGGTQLWIAPLKVAGGLLVSALICLPSLYVFSCLAGSQAKLGEVVVLVGGLLALTTILLIGFAPVAWVFSQSTSSAVAMGALHLAFWFVATCFGWRFLRTGFQHLSAQSTGTLHVWIVIFVLVCLQMTTALRPIVGTSKTIFPTEKKFFIHHWIDSTADRHGSSAGERTYENK